MTSVLPRLRLVPPAREAGGTLPRALDESQAEAVAVAAARPVTVVAGAPGTGKTTVAAHVAVEALRAGTQPERVLVLAASRRSAARMRDDVAARAGRTVGAPMVRTVASAAFAVLRTRELALDGPPPTLVSGPEQDLVLAELLAGHAADQGAALELPPGLPPESLGLRGLRQELRDLLMRAAERGLGPVELHRLGRAHDRPEWVMAAKLYEEYLDVMTLRSGTPDTGARFDPAVVVDEAAQALRSWETDLPDLPRPTWDLVVVDDYQEATAATARLLHVLHDDGARLVLLGDPDSAVQGFRGAAPGLVGRAGAASGVVGAFDATTVVLGTAWRQGAELREVTRAVTGRIPVLASALHRRAGARPDDDVSPGDGPSGERPSGGARHEASAEAGPGDDVVPDDDVGQHDRSDEPGHGAPGDDASHAAPAWDPRRRAARTAPPTGPTGAQVAVLPGAAQEAAWIARELRAEHLLYGTPWERMAVIARSGTRLAALRRELASASVPVAFLGSDLPLRDEPAVAPLLAAVRVAAGAPRGSLEALLASEIDGPDTEALDPVTAALLLTSPVGGLDAVGLRRLRRALRSEELAGGGGRSSDALLVEVLGDPLRAELLPEPVRRAPVQVARVLAAGRAAAAEPGATAQTVLWAVWDATGLAERWRRYALGGGPGALRADRDLDAVLALFRAAETFVDRMPGAPVPAFVDYLESQDLPADSLAAAGTGAGAVEALTPAGAAGREWDVVVVAGVQDGVWPDLRLRDSLLGSQALVELYAGRADDARVHGAEARRQVLADELRAFAVATSRARRRLLVTAVEDAEDAPSVFCDLVSPRNDDGEGPDPRRTEVGPPLDLRGVVAAARAELVRAVTAAAAATQPAAAPEDASPPRVVVPESARAAARLLAELAGAGIAEADPTTWYGVAGASSEAPLWGPRQSVTVSPSKVETVSTCALRWVFEAAGGTAPDATHQSLGTLLHSIAQEHPTGALHELKAELDRRWPELALPDGWPARQLRGRAEQMVERLAAYLAGSGEPLLVEADFDLRVGRARLRGQVDRVEDAGEGGVRVADLKTGKSAQSKAEATENPQLGAYQLAVEEGALGLPEGTVSKGASLVYVGTPTAGPTVREQPSLDPGPDGGSWARDVVEQAADTMASASFAAQRNKLCEMCAVRRSCPLQPEGRKVVE